MDKNGFIHPGIKQYEDVSFPENADAVYKKNGCHAGDNNRHQQYLVNAAVFRKRCIKQDDNQNKDY